MAIGDTSDFVGRLRAALPAGWFATTAAGQESQTPILDALLTGIGTAWSSVYALLTYATAQTRIATATDSFLDMIAEDFFALGLQRLPQETDAAFSARIRANLLPDEVTREALIARVTTLVGRAPVIFEPSYAADTGGYGTLTMTQGTGLGYGVAGGYGSILLPAQFFIKAYRPHIGGISVVAGYASGPSGDYAAPIYPAAGTAILSGGQIIGVSGGLGGSNLLAAPPVEVIAVTSTPATIYAVIDGGAVVDYVITFGGAGYSGTVLIGVGFETAIPGGYADGASTPPAAVSGYSAYQSLPTGPGVIDDALIYSTIAATIADGVTAWAQISN